MVAWGGVPVQKPYLKQNQFHQRGPPQWVPQVIHPPQWAVQQQWRPQQWRPQQQWRPPQQRSAPPALPAGFEVDENARYTGLVTTYHKWKGYGFVEVAQGGVVPNDKLFVHWKTLQTDDRFPTLQKGMEVEFGLTVQREFGRGGTTVRAKNVTMVGGMSIAMQDDLDAQQKQFVGGQHLRYTGTLKFFTPRHGFGYVVMDQGYDVDPSVPSELRVETSEVNAGGREPRFMENLAVEFGIWRTSNMKHKVYNMTLPGGHPLTQDALENRISMGPQSYGGEVAIWNWRAGWGFVRIDSSIVLPPRVVAKLAQQSAAAKQRGKNITNDKMLYFRRADCAPSAMVQQGMRVQFQLYIDDKGAGACDLRG
mmetsp:Transcript_77937/g.210768  ORF Transcript_77937/g.210768 Transcript_77937/m.210768 type:complete len:365 (-) Transcript_77937:151-1245(-)